jgi:pimeloyl-ACP methyl ester carboxylesterase
MQKATPFKIEVSQPVLDDLQVRLQRTRWTDAPANAGWNYGTNPDYLQELVAYWQNTYDWRKQEAALNEIPQFVTEIDGISIHFAYVKGKGKNPKPLLLSHGWPDSFYRFYKLIPLLTETDEEGQSFDLVIPSLPGFGFSGHTSLNPEQVAGLWSKLMKVDLGYTAYYALGGDMSTEVVKSMGRTDAAVKGLYLTDVGYPNGSEDWSTLSPAEQEFGKFIQQWWYKEGAYNMLQSTKPQTLGYGLNDSPVGLASWIIEKFNAWSDHPGNIENNFTKDELLTNIMIYWVSQTINSAIRMYLEVAHASYGPEGPKPVVKVEVPTGVGAFPGDAPLPREWAARMVNLKRFTQMPRGGHFSALDATALLAEDVRSFFLEDLKSQWP